MGGGEVKAQGASERGKKKDRTQETKGSTGGDCADLLPLQAEPKASVTRFRQRKNRFLAISFTENLDKIRISANFRFISTLVFLCVIEQKLCNMGKKVCKPKKRGNTGYEKSVPTAGSRLCGLVFP